MIRMIRIGDSQFRPGELLYLASPYTHDRPEIVEQRAEAAATTAAQLWALGLPTFGPIAHSETIIAKAIRHGYRQPEHSEWMRFDLEILSGCDALIVLTLEGWASSKGVQQERDHARNLGIPVHFVSPMDIYDAASELGCI